MIIALDFDRTLFDTEKWYKYFFSKDEFKSISDLNNFKRALENYILNTELDINISDYLYPDVISFLEKYKSSDLVLVTTTTHPQQKKIVKGSGIVDYFSKVYFVSSNEEKAKVLYNFNQKVVFLDDLVSNLEDVQNKCKNSTVVLMDRNNVADNKDFPVVSNLKEFEGFI